MNSRPLVSVVIPTYNYGRFIGQAVDGVLAQTYDRLEIIVVDDGSTDDTTARLQPYEKRIRYIKQQNLGPEGARNTGLAAATGEFIAFLDPDDAWVADKIRVQLEVFDKFPEACLVCSNTQRLTENFNSNVTFTQPLQGDVLSLADVYLHNPICTSSVMARKRHVDQTGHFRKGIRSEDWDLWMRLARVGQMVKIAEPLVGYRDHEANRSKNVDAELPWAVRVVDDNFAALPATAAYRRLHRQALAQVYLSGSRLYHLRHNYRTAFATLWKSLAAWPLGFPATVRRVPLERCRYGVRLLQDACRRNAAPN